MAFDSSNRIGYLVVNRLPSIVKLIPRDKYRAASRQGTINGFSAQFTSQSGTPYGMVRPELLNEGIYCLKGPWSRVVAVDLDSAEVV